MAGLIEIMKSKGKIGGVGLMMIGAAQMAMIFFGKEAGSYGDGAALFFAGLSLLGIRSKQG